MINHFGLIPDGNRRWALKNGLELPVAYSISMKHIEEIIDRAFIFNIRYVSVYLLSTENLKRKRADLDAVIDAESDLCLSLIDRCRKFQCKVVHVGLSDYLPLRLVNSIDKLRDETSKYSDFNLNLLIGYNPFDEINTACKSKKDNIEISDLWVNEEVDLVIRTGGGKLPLSNFLPLQSGYAQCRIVDELFNDFSIDSFDSIIKESSMVNLLNGK